MDPSSPLETRLAADLDACYPELVTSYEGVIYSTALRLSGSPDQAFDLAAETFLRAYAGLRRYDAEKIATLKVRGYLVTIVLNLWRNEVRQATRRPHLVALDQAREPTSTNESVEEAAERRDDSRKLAHLLADLPETERIAVVLRHVGGLDYREVALLLHCPIGTAKSHVHRGLNQLRDELVEPKASFRQSKGGRRASV